MTTTTFIGVGDLTGNFTIDDFVVARLFVPGEVRIQTPFPYPALERWRRHALEATSISIEPPTQGRTTVLFAHENGMGSVFFGLTDADPSILAGNYNHKQQGVLVDAALTGAYASALQVFAELKQQQVPPQYIQFIQQRLESATFSHRVTGLCAAVYLTALLLEQTEAVT